MPALGFAMGDVVLGELIDEIPQAREIMEKTIAADAGLALARTTDRDSRLHLEDVRDQIAKILDPKFQLANPTPIPVLALPLSDNGDIFCWTDYAIE